MKAAQFAEYGTPDVLEIADIAEPRPGQVRIKVRAVGVNPVDWKIRSGMLAEILPATLPLITGTDAAGVVVDTGIDIPGPSARRPAKRPMRARAWTLPSANSARPSGRLGYACPSSEIEHCRQISSLCLSCVV
ncbi:alcohol dehydrogenase catalytic domain-containing protein [Saccharopolyspora sp. 5N708]|uniref:alcohol dehydrogenase catalytic domain-containing protein n=1 Tax=Saccharopolyspora sp. 5N708 TaxID=3457424 RepID=UPI003FD01080